MLPAQKYKPSCGHREDNGRAESGPVTGATIAVKGTKNITTSGEGGDFSIIAQPGEVLEVSFVGYKSKEIKIEANT